MKSSLNSIRSRVLNFEAKFSTMISDEVEDLRKIPGGEQLAAEFVLTVCALLSARSIAMVHLWTSESVDSIRKRLVETMDDDVKTSVRRLRDLLTKQGTIIPGVFPGTRN